jgi:hypothetical protein
MFVPKWTPLAPMVPASCLIGFEMNNLAAHTLSLSSAGGSHQPVLEVDLATYTAADAIRMTAIEADGSERVLLDTCRMRTAEYSDPTEGRTRPPEDSIRDYRIDLNYGTKQIVIDSSNALSPTYIRILGLCDFDIQPPPATELRADEFRIVTAR